MEVNPDDTRGSHPSGQSSSERGRNRLGEIAALASVAGILIFLFVTRDLGIALAVGAIVLGIVARFQARSRYLRTGIATLPIVLGLLLLALWGLILYGESIWPI